MRAITYATFVHLILWASPSYAEGPDVIVGYLDNTESFGREVVAGNTFVGIAAATTSCNIGNKNLNWRAIPDSSHPVISLNLYRLKDGQMKQLGQSWVKHGFFATNDDGCPHLTGVSLPPCVRPDAGNVLAPGCSDPYSQSLNADPRLLGPRSKINPATGIFDGAKAQDLTGYPPSSDLQRIIYVNEKDLSADDGTYFIEAQYVTADDAGAGNGNNNVTFRRVRPKLTAAHEWVFLNVDNETRTLPAVRAWDGAKFSEIASQEAAGAKSSITVASKATVLRPGMYRYDYLIHNLNSDLAVQAFSVPSTASVSAISFHAPPSHGELWSNELWKGSNSGGGFTWETEKYAQNKNANAIRWGTSYSFSFESSKPPRDVVGKVTRFKPNGANLDPEIVSVAVMGPGT